ncbi:hypothetical protein IMZ38_01625 [Thermosphaera chiliense]|uniref:Uncharacterized protein n=1 Tax=Thermosphaera chiliense TaxID=3402707 RepID=A0A7M1UR54_9CREN|nr:hypothetical protein [Thermosphaera aggregans]QOR94661.1 hypothetical protein IMZ38_01625 [Thermosphaera aggregans]
MPCSVPSITMLKIQSWTADRFPLWGRPIIIYDTRLGLESKMDFSIECLEEFIIRHKTLTSSVHSPG